MLFPARGTAIAIIQAAGVLAMGHSLPTAGLTVAGGTSTDPVHPARVAAPQTVRVLIDDFVPQPYRGERIYSYNRVDGDRGALNDADLAFGVGQVTVTVAPSRTWGGMWFALNHPNREHLPIDLSAVLPTQIAAAYQSRVTGLVLDFERATPDSALVLELKDGGPAPVWTETRPLHGGAQTIAFDPTFEPGQQATELTWSLQGAEPGETAVLRSASLTVANPITDTATAAFVWSYGMLLANWDPDTGLVRDKARDASGEFDAIQSTGALAAATALAHQLGIVSADDAKAIVGKIAATLLSDVPRYKGLWPHWVRVDNGTVEAHPASEWSSIDTVIAALGLLDAQVALGLDPTMTVAFLQTIDWSPLWMADGVSMGYSPDGKPLQSQWDTFGGESWLVALANAVAHPSVMPPPMRDPSPPTADGSGFIDELAWLFVPAPPHADVWGTDWRTYRQAAARAQAEYFDVHHPDSCAARTGLFGLSAAEVPAPDAVEKASIYQAFGVGGRSSAVNDGCELLGSPVVVPHYSAMTAALQPDRSLETWTWLIEEGHFSPLNNVESLMHAPASSCDPAALQWNALKGSWNLALQSLGWGLYLVQRSGQLPSIHRAASEIDAVHQAYVLIAGPNRLYLPSVVDGVRIPTLF